MKRNALGLFGAYAMMAMLSEDSYPKDERADNPTKPKDIDVKIKAVLPNGCKWYYFFKDGDISENEERATYFKCIAKDENNAKRKFDNFIKNK